MGLSPFIQTLMLDTDWPAKAVIGQRWSQTHSTAVDGVSIPHAPMFACESQRSE